MELLLEIITVSRIFLGKCQTISWKFTSKMIMYGIFIENKKLSLQTGCNISNTGNYSIIKNKDNKEYVITV